MATIIDPNKTAFVVVSLRELVQLVHEREGSRFRRTLGNEPRLNGISEEPSEEITELIDFLVHSEVVFLPFDQKHRDL